MYVRELVLSYRARPTPLRVDDDRQLLTPTESAEVFCGLLSRESVEVFGLLCLTTKYSLSHKGRAGDEAVSEGA